MGTSKLWSCGFFFAILIACLFNSGESLTLVITQANGSLALPDPGPINTFLKLNTTLRNPLLPEQPPLQLRLCHSSFFSTSVDFYTLETSYSCERAPEQVAVQSKNKRRLESAIWVSTVVSFGCLVTWVLARQFSTRLREALSPIPFFLDIRDPSAWFDREWEFWLSVLWAYGTFFIISLGPVLYACWIGKASPELAPLPDPAVVNHFLTTGGQNLTLSLCTVRDVFQVYLGFSDGCHQAQTSFYSGVNKPSESDPPNVHGVGQTFLLIFSTSWTFALWFTLCVAGLYHGGRVLDRCFPRPKVCDIEMHHPAESAVLV